MDALTPALGFLLAAFGAWRVTHLIAEEDGPADLVLRLRARLGHGVWASLMDCFQCLSLWIAVPFAFVVTQSLVLWVPAWLAVSGAACLLERLGSPPVAWPLDPAHFPENGDVLLRPRPGGPEI